MKLKIKIIALFVICAMSSVNTQAQEPFLGEIRLFAGNFAPRGWAFCEGQLLPISQNTALFSLLGTIYGGDGRTDFALPDLRGRVVIGPGNGPGLSNYQEGQKGGSETNTLNINELPSHSHGLDSAILDVKLAVNSEEGESSNPNGEFLAAEKDSYIDEVESGKFLGGITSSLSGTTTSTGNNQAIDNRQPYLSIRYIIALQGIYPPRN